METIKVNMNPNPLDVQTIHASQNDGEARQWGFELHNNGELIDTSDVKEQMVFKAYEGGTEQILPENTSTPTTSPFLGDIKYPQGLLSGQEFLYRQSPTEEDGLAWIKTIKGNTLVWNQLVENGDFSTSSGWAGQFATVTISNGVASVRQDRAGDYVALRKQNLQGLTGHKYLVVADVKSAKKTAIAFYLSNAYSSVYDIQANTRTVVRAIITVSNANTGGFNVYTNRKVELAEGDVVEIYHVMLFDLTQMGLDITDPSDFTSLFPLSYYSYNQGTLLSFNGNGIKTVGKNLFDFSQFANGTITFENDVLTGTAGQFYTSYRDVVNNGIELKYPKNTQITISFDARTEQNDSPSGGGVYFLASENGASVQLVETMNNTTEIQHKSITIPSSRHIDKLGWTYGSNPGNIWHITNFQVEFGTETEYEPYNTQTTNLPISTYFPTGMKSARSVYDELTETKAITRIGSVDLGTLTWTKEQNHFYSDVISNSIKPSAGIVPNIICSKYLTYAYAIVISETKDGAIGLSSTPRIYVYDSSYTDATAFKTAMNGVMLYYELATPTETSFTTASLVTENGEIPLSNEDGVLIGKCTEQLSAEPGFHNAKIKLSDSDGDVYSNKIQLHVERSPQ